MIVKSIALVISMLMVTIIGLSFFQQRAAQARLDLELVQLSQQLSEANARVAQSADYTVKFMHYRVEENRHQRHEVMALKSAEALHARTSNLLHKIRTLRQVLVRADSSADSLALRLPHKTKVVEQLRHADRLTFSTLRQPLAAYNACIRKYNPADSTQLVVPSYDAYRSAVAVGSLTQLENDVLTTEAQTLQHIAQLIGSKEPRAKVVAVATVQSNRVAPGDTYRAHLLLVKSLTSPSIQMFCNGHVVPVDRDGAGLVCFKAPDAIGPAEWHGAIHVRLRGRDTTFQVRVPYRVVRR